MIRLDFLDALVSLRLQGDPVQLCFVIFVWRAFKIKQMYKVFYVQAEPERPIWEFTFTIENFNGKISKKGQKLVLSDALAVQSQGL